LAKTFIDVALKDGATVIQQNEPRAKASRHFYEPGPILGALRALASSAKERDAVVFRRAGREPVTAGEVLESIDSDPGQGVAKEFFGSIRTCRKP
jgi:hypothetical protein